MKHYVVDPARKWDYENGFYLTCETSRIGKWMNHLDLYKRIVGLPGDVLEFGVYKGASFARLIAFRDLLESSTTRRVIGFDTFEEFPADLSLESDRRFADEFQRSGGPGIRLEDLRAHLERKETTNFDLVKGDIRETLPRFLAENPGLQIALIHIDVDVYEPTKLILERLFDRLVEGGILMLDDYGTVEGETKAVDEYFADRPDKIQALDYYHIPRYVVKS